MRPKLLTPRNFILVLVAALIIIGFYRWIASGGRLFGIGEVASTAGKVLFVSDRKDAKTALYMMDGKEGAAEAVPITADGGGSSDAEPAWSPDGGQIAFTSDRAGAVRQVFVVNAAAGQRIVNRTNTSATKEAPAFGADGFLYFLDGGKIARISLTSPETEAVFPTAMQKKDELASIFASGGIVRYAVSEDGSRIASVVKLEQGEALILYYPRDHVVALGGFARRIAVRESAGGLLVGLFGGRPTTPTNPETGVSLPPQAVPLFIPEQLPKAADQAVWPISASDENYFVRIDSEGKFEVLGQMPPEMKPNDLALSPDGKIAVVTADEGNVPGVFLLSLDGSGTSGPIHNVPAREPSISPDGKQVAYVSGKDVFVAPTETNATPVNLTKGAGTNTSPLWSPRAVVAAAE